MTTRPLVWITTGGSNAVSPTLAHAQLADVDYNYSSTPHLRVFPAGNIVALTLDQTGGFEWISESAGILWGGAAPTARGYLRQRQIDRGGLRQRQTPSLRQRQTFR